jgi:phage terminase large subunit
MSRAYKLREGSLQDRFQKSRAKVQIFGGGFGNGKTTSGVIKALKLAKDYPGSNGLVARATFPKLNATIRKEFTNWTPPSWIKRDVNSRDNLIELTNGSIINFSYIAQGGKNNESSTSNLLSATYDWIVIDQVEDPEITEKDFLDLLGRLRGQTTYQGDDPTMPTTGPRWMILMCNPTRNWVYRKLVKPLQDLKVGIENPDLLRDPETDEVMVELFEGSTYENKENLPEDFIKTQEAAYKGQMRKRFLLGEWGAFEGLVYPQYDPSVHILQHQDALEYFRECQDFTDLSIVEAYDHGIASPACYGFGFVDPFGNIILLDGLYQKELTVSALSREIKAIRKKYDFEPDDEHRILADPAVFKRTSGSSKTVGTTTAGLFKENGIRMERGNNDILNGIAKVQSYLELDEKHLHPITQIPNAPYLFVSTNCPWWDHEIVDYYWKKDQAGEYEDTPMDRNDHAMDMTKYLLTKRPRIANFKPVRMPIPARYTRWSERDMPSNSSRAKQHRYG